MKDRRYLIKLIKSSGMIDFMKKGNNFCKGKMTLSEDYSDFLKDNNFEEKQKEKDVVFPFINIVHSDRRGKNSYKNLIKETRSQSFVSFKNYKNNIKHAINETEPYNCLKNESTSIEKNELENENSYNIYSINKPLYHNDSPKIVSKINKLSISNTMPLKTDVSRPKVMIKKTNPNFYFPKIKYLNKSNNDNNFGNALFNKRDYPKIKIGRNINNFLFAPLEKQNFEKEVENIGNNFITFDKYIKSDNKKKKFVIDTNENPQFIEKFIKYDKLRRIKFKFNYNIDKSKNFRFLSDFYKINTINKI